MNQQRNFLLVCWFYITPLLLFPISNYVSASRNLWRRKRFAQKDVVW